MISFSETAWARMDFGAPAPERQKELVTVASAAGTAGTTETIQYHPASGDLYRTRSWFGSHRSGPAGSVWFIAIREG